MIDEKYIGLVTGHLQNTLTEEERRQLNGLIGEGKIDPSELREMETVCAGLDSLNAPEPGPGMSRRFHAMLEDEKGRRWPVLFRRIVYAAAFFLMGLMAGSGLLAPDRQDEQVAGLATEVSELKEMMMINLLSNASPIERLKAVQISNDLAPADQRVAAALLHTLNTDSNVNVRLAAVNALMRHAANPEVRQGMVSSITMQESPVVQIALADAMQMLGEGQSVDEFRKLLEQNEMDATVRNKLENTIASLI
ncbi:MAG: hypothetical protein WD266_04580 [Balneolales bacterium]